MTARTRRKRKPSLMMGAPDMPMPATPEYAQHHDVDERPGPRGGRAGYRVRTRLDSLLAAQEITAAEWMAGDLYRRDYETAEMGGASAGYGEAGGGDGCPATARLNAVTRLVRARAALSATERVAADGVALDLAWPALGARLSCGKDRARAEAVAALRDLAGHYRLHATGGRMRVIGGREG